MQRVWQDLRFALRQLRKAPGFTFMAVLTLSLSVGAATAVFSVIDAVIIRPLPFNHPERLVFPNTTARAGYGQPASLLSYRDERAQLKSFEALAGYSDYYSVNLESPSGPVSLHAVKGTDNFFNVFGVHPMLGRTFLPGEDQPGKDDIAVLSYEVWQTNFGGDTSVVGKQIRLNGLPYTVIGVMPAGFRYPLSMRNAIYTPLHPDLSWAANRGTHWLRTVGRMKEGVSREQAQADFARVLNDLGRAFPDTDAGRKVQLQPLAAQVEGKASKPLITLAFAVLAVLMIGCVNIAGLLLARGVAREREIAMRAAVGASRWRLVRQMLTESLALALFGMIGGIAVSWLLLVAVRTFLVSAMARGADIHLNWLVLLTALVLSAAASIVASLAPAIRTSGVDPNRALKAGGNAGTGQAQHRVRAAFIVTQVALSLVLLVVSGLLLRTVADYRNSDLGFNPKHILTLEIALSPGRYASRDPLVDFYRPLLERVTHLPDVKAAGLISILPIENWGSNSDVHITGQPPYPPEQEMLAETRMVTPGYFEAMGIPLERGRNLSPAQDTSTNKAGSVVVNQAFVRKFFTNGGDPVGQHIDDSDKAEEKTAIVGVMRNIRQNLYAPPLAEMDWLVDEVPPKDRLSQLSIMSLIVRADGDPEMLIPSLRSVFHDIDATIPFRTPETMTEVVSDTLVFERMESWLFGIFASLAVLLAVVGLYGLIGHEVELRRRDIGVRMALGATRAMVLGMIYRRVLWMLAGGVVCGVAATFAARRLIASVVTMRAMHDAAVIAAVAAVLVVAGVLAAWLPAMRAASIDPSKALRTD
jgi:putative ABC transport system permease protein